MQCIAGCCQQTFGYKKFVNNSQQCFVFTHQANFPAHDLIFTEDEGDEFESRLPFRIFSTLIVSLFLYDPFCRNTLEVSYHNLQ